jgi:hypothetical protein
VNVGVGVGDDCRGLLGFRVRLLHLHKDAGRCDFVAWFALRHDFDKRRRQACQ